MVMFDFKLNLAKLSRSVFASGGNSSSDEMHKIFPFRILGLIQGKDDLSNIVILGAGGNPGLEYTWVRNSSSLSSENCIKLPRSTLRNSTTCFKPCSIQVSTSAAGRLKNLAESSEINSSKRSRSSSPVNIGRASPSTIGEGAAFHGFLSTAPFSFILRQILFWINPI